MGTRLILAGDVGGTKTHLGLFEATDLHIELRRDRLYATRDFYGLEEVLTDFVSETGKISAACFGVPGPVVDGVSHAVNVPWTSIEQTALTAVLDGAPARLLNDLEATAYGVLHLTEGDTLVLQQGKPQQGDANKCVIAAGTGLGEAGLIATPTGYYAVASEGGHGDFAPVTREQADLLAFLEQEFGHVSFERVLSGPGLANIYRFVTSRSRSKEPDWLLERLTTEDPGAVVGEVALKGGDPSCIHALELFAAIYGAEAANLALKFFAVGGVYLAGGIAPRILPFLIKDDTFVRAFCDKGRLKSTLEKIEVRISLNTSAGLMGAAHVAASMKSMLSGPSVR